MKKNQSSNIVATSMMMVDESDVLLVASTDGELNWILDSGNAYHLW